MPLSKRPLIGIIMGSDSDFETMNHASQTLTGLQVSHEIGVVSAHRTPEWIGEYVRCAERRKIQVIIAGAGGAAHLPGMVSSETDLPVIGVPIQSKALHGMDSLLSIVQMPGGIPVATMSIGEAGGINAGIHAARILALHNPQLKKLLTKYRKALVQKVITANTNLARQLKGTALPIPFDWLK
jgi:5-(carboxyamino)imidazole ribonucleotide mutase